MIAFRPLQVGLRKDSSVPIITPGEKEKKKRPSQVKHQAEKQVVLLKSRPASQV